MQRRLTNALRLVAVAIAWLALSTLSARANDPTVWLDVIGGVRVWHYDHPGVGIASIGHEFSEGSCEVHVKLDSAGHSSAYYTHAKDRVVCRFRVRLVPHEPRNFSQHYFMQHIEAPKFATRSLAQAPYNIVGPGNSITVGTSVDVHFWPYDPFNGKTSSPEGPVMACQQRVENAGANRKKLLADGFTVPLRSKVRLELRYVPSESTKDAWKSEDSIYADTDLDVVIRCLGNIAAANEAYPPPVRDHPFLVTAASLVLFHKGEPLTGKLETSCAVPIGHRPRFTTVGDLPGDVRYHFEWTSGQRSTPYVKTDKGDRTSPLYEVPEAYHEFPYPLPAAGAGGGASDPDGSFAAEGKDAGPKFTAPSGPQNEHKGSVRVVATNDSGATVASGWAPYHIVCKQAAVAVSGTLDLRDSGGNQCPRRGEAAISIRTDVPGPMSYHVACDGGRTWSDTVASQKTGPNTHIAVAVLPFQIERRETVGCTLRTGKLQKVLAQDSRAYSCTTGGGGLVVVPPPHPPPGEPPRVIVDPPKVACVGGRLAGAGKRQRCVCPGGHTLKRLGPTSFRCERKATVGVRCIGGGVRIGQCVCAPSMRRVPAGGPNTWRCVPRGGSAAGSFGVTAPGKGRGPTKPAPGIRKGSKKGAAARVR